MWEFSNDAFKPAYEHNVDECKIEVTPGLLIVLDVLPLWVSANTKKGEHQQQQQLRIVAIAMARASTDGDINARTGIALDSLS